MRKKIENSRRNEEIYKLLNLSTNKLVKINDTALEVLPKMLFNSEYFNIDNTAFKKELTQKIKEFDFEKTIFNIIDLGRSPQEAGILDGYFSLFFVLVPSSLLKE